MTGLGPIRVRNHPAYVIVMRVSHTAADMFTPVGINMPVKKNNVHPPLVPRHRTIALIGRQDRAMCPHVESIMFMPYAKKYL